MKLRKGYSCFRSSIIFAFCLFLLSATCAIGQEESEIVVKIPEHVPIKLELENTDTEDLFRDVVIKCKNTGNKPIYSLRLTLSPTDMKAENGLSYAFPLKYRGTAARSIDELAQPEDTPLMPGETYIFKNFKKMAAAFKKSEQTKGRPYPNKFEIIFNSLFFGDGTGLTGTDASLVDSRKSSSKPISHDQSLKENLFFFFDKPFNYDSRLRLDRLKATQHKSNCSKAFAFNNL